VTVGGEELADGVDDLYGGYGVLLRGQDDREGFATVNGA
jgi:hypothetical protein